MEGAYTRLPPSSPLRQPCCAALSAAAASTAASACRTAGALGHACRAASNDTYADCHAAAAHSHSSAPALCCAAGRLEARSAAACAAASRAAAVAAHAVAADADDSAARRRALTAAGAASAGMGSHTSGAGRWAGACTGGCCGCEAGAALRCCAARLSFSIRLRRICSDCSLRLSIVFRISMWSCRPRALAACLSSCSRLTDKAGPSGGGPWGPARADVSPPWPGIAVFLACDEKAWPTTLQVEPRARGWWLPGSVPAF